jgi:ubiquinone/menaquinone biosynthesis C-methylase UbiE
MKAEFDDKAASWDDDPIRVARAEAIGKVLGSRIDLKQVNKALEYGSGTGLLSFALKDQLNDVLMMDESEQMVAVANSKCQAQHVSHMQAMQYDLTNKSYDDDRFDLIYLLLTLHHIPDDEFILKRFYNLLNSGGYLAIIDLDKEDGSFHDGEFHGHLGFDRTEIEEKLKKIGFSIFSYEICYELEKEKEGGKRVYPLFLLIAQKD